MQSIIFLFEKIELCITSANNKECSSPGVVIFESIQTVICTRKIKFTKYYYQSQQERERERKRERDADSICAFAFEM